MDMERLRATGHRAAGAYKAAGVLMLNAVVCWLCLEIAGMVFLKLAPGFAGPPAGGEEIDARSRSPYYHSQNWAPQYWHEFQLSRKQRYEPFVLWKRAPFQGATINIDEQGLRRTPGAVCGADSVKVFVLGGSTVWGTGAPDWGTIPAYLQKGLEQLHDGPVCVVNFGESAFVSTQGVLTLLRQLQLGNVPQLVVFYDGPNDVYSAYQSGRSDAHQNLDQLARVFEAGERGSRRSLRQTLEATSLFRVTDGLVRRLMTTAPDENKQASLLTYETMGIDPETLSTAIGQTYLINYQVVDALAAKYGFRYAFFWSPHISIGTKPLVSEERAIEASVAPALKKLYQSVFPWIEQAAPQYPNLHSIASVFDGYNELLWLDDAHVTPEGNRILARTMLQVLYSGSQGDTLRRSEGR
jgi:hypothetical protein